MSETKPVHKENALLQRGIFSSTDFEAFQKSEVCVCHGYEIQEISQLKKFMKICVEAVKGKPISSQKEVPPVHSPCLRSSLDCKENGGRNAGTEYMDR